MRSSENADFHCGLALGLFIAAISCGLLFGVLKDFQLTQETYANLSLGIIAISSAMISAFTIRNQIQSNIDLEEERIKRKERAARALLPNALHDLHGESKKIASQLWKPSANFEADWSYFSSAFQNIEKCIEFSSPSNAEMLTSLIIHYQILRARSDELLHSKGLICSHSDEINLEFALRSRCENLVYWLFFLKLVESGFKYARNDEQEYRYPQMDASHYEHLLIQKIDIVADTKDQWNAFQNAAREFDDG